jgi:hypothetical protein
MSTTKKERFEPPRRDCVCRRRRRSRPAAHAAATRAEAKAAARHAVGGGRVTKVEHFNAGRVRWEIDVRRNGRSWEVKLSRTLRVLSKDLRHGGGDDDGPNHH